MALDYSAGSKKQQPRPLSFLASSSPPRPTSMAQVLHSPRYIQVGGGNSKKSNTSTALQQQQQQQPQASLSGHREMLLRAVFDFLEAKQDEIKGMMAEEHDRFAFDDQMSAVHEHMKALAAKYKIPPILNESAFYDELVNSYPGGHKDESIWKRMKVLSISKETTFFIPKSLPMFLTC